MTALLTLIQWLSPAFPTGGFAYSHGLEQVIAQKVVKDAASMERWLRNILTYGAGWQDAVLLCAALRPVADLDALDATARALQPSSERLRESAEQGAALSRTIAGIGAGMGAGMGANTHGDAAGGITARALPPRLLPIAVGQAAAGLGLMPEIVAQVYLQGFATNLCTIAIRHIPLGQTQGQAMLARLLPLVADLGIRAAQASLDDLGNSALAADLAAMQHETMDVRIFRT